MRSMLPKVAACLFLAAGAHPAAASVITAYVVLGEDGAAVARALTDAPACPAIDIDGHTRTMARRAPAATLPQRPTQSTPDKSKPSEFSAQVCEAGLPAGARQVRVDGRPLPVPRGAANRIVVIGDTGCRLKASDNAYQACNDRQRYPFATIAAKAAAWKPDLIVHVGDLVYRENPCIESEAGCAGSPWGYGLDVWRADFFDPAAPLLRAAPWVMVRGNHESCSRAGQGWWRFIDPRPLTDGRDCNDPANDTTGDYSPPYAVPLGDGAQIVVMDLSIAGTKPIPTDDPRVGQFAAAHQALAQLARQADFTFAADHYPILGISAETKEDAGTLKPGNAAVQSVFGRIDPGMVPPGVDVLLAGHVHLWEQVSFASAHPSQFIAGFSGTEEDVAPLPSHLPADFQPAPGATIDRFDAWLNGFGYMTFERTGHRTWRATVWDVEGTPVKHCRIDGRLSHCDDPQVAGHP